jgi:cell division septation protein DedD
VKVENYIGELLQWHNCVIVPELGGFIAHYAPAKINTAQNIFSPPSKNIAFNINLKNSDGLLVSHIATQENIPFALAAKIVSDQVANWCNLLNKGKKISLKSIGKLYFDKELNIQFEPVVDENFLLDSFGLVEFHSPAIKREAIHEKIEKQFKDRPAIRQQAKKFRWKKVALTALSIPLLAALAILPLQRDLYYNLSVEYSSIIPFSSFEKPQYQPRADFAQNSSGETIDEDESVEAPELEITAENENVAEAEIMETIIETPFTNTVAIALPEVKPAEAKVAKPETVVAKAEAISGSFFIIGGCFSIEENAHKYVSDLKQKGFQARVVDQNKGLFRVSYGNYESREDANNALVRIKEENAGAWVLKK